MRSRNFMQVDVFGTGPQRGNPVAVVLDADGLDTAAMQRFANWTNLSETTFVLPPSSDAADYRVRIFTPTTELPFAGHPTLGTCHAWLQAAGEAAAGNTEPRTRSGADDAPAGGGAAGAAAAEGAASAAVPSDAGAPGGLLPGERVVQECGAGLVEIRRTAGGLAFAAPPLLRSGPVEPALVADVVAALGIAAGDVVEAQWVDNGPGWLAVLLGSAQQVLALTPSFIDLDVGVVGPHPAGSAEAVEVRAFFPKDGALLEDPVTGSLNASLAQWLLSSGRLNAPYVARQGTALGREGRVHVTQDADATIWVGGSTFTCIEGTVTL